VVVLVPVAFGAPAVLVFIPPAMLLTPATLARFMQFTTFALGLPAVASVSLNGLVKFMLSVSDSALAAVDVFCVEPWRCGEEQGCGQDRARENGYSCGGKLWLTIHESASQGKDVEKSFAPVT
jgi:hypothetical protein